MKALPAGLSASLATGATTLCWCWRVERRDGAVFGFTDHDRPLAFDGVDYEPGTGWAGSDLAASSGLAVDTQEAEGVLSSDAIAESDIAATRWDGAAVTLFRVDWTDTALRAAVFAGSFGEISRGPVGYRVELRSLAHALNQPVGRVFSSTCDARLGDARCGVDLDDPAYSSAATVAAAASRRSFTSTGLAAFADGWFGFGRVVWTSGPNAGLEFDVKRHALAGSTATVELIEEAPFDIAAGHGFTIEAGCDRRIETCGAKFGNTVNFRGFPHMPGNDWVGSYPSRGQGNDGGRRG